MLPFLSRILTRAVKQPVYRFSQHLPSFAAFDFLPTIKSYLQAADFHTPSSIQEKAISQLMQLAYLNHYIISPTGTGKTLAYLLPVINSLKLDEQSQQKILTQPKRPRCLIVVSSKELVDQVADVAKQISHHCKLKVLGLSGALTLNREEEILKKGVDIVIGTLDRIDKHRDHLYLSSLSHLVIDELDTLIDASFSEKLQKYIEAVKKRQIRARDSGTNPPRIVLVSATFTKAIDQFFNSSFRWYERDPRFYSEAELDRLENANAFSFKAADEFSLRKIVDRNTNFNLQNIKHEFVHCSESDRHEPLYSQLRQHSKASVMVFCNTVASLHELQYFLAQRKVETVTLHGDLPQPSRQANIHKFRGQNCKVLLCTDLGSRGLDFPFLEYVVNYDFPRTISDYLHRAGRTGRAGKSGTAITLYHNKHLKVINQLKLAHTSNKPLNIKDSAYSLANKESFTSSPGRNPKARKSPKPKRSLRSAKQIKRRETLREKRRRTSQ